jgi:hypothetical protein
MKRKTTKIRCVLLDADIIIKAHELDVWQQLLNSFEICVPSIVIHREAKYYNSKSGHSFPIKLQELVDSGEITEISASVQEMADFRSEFNSPEIDDGETEALTVLWKKSLDGYKYCTADRAAIIVSCLMDLHHHVVSMETLLSSIGISRPLRSTCQEDVFKKIVNDGLARKIQGDGLK